MALVSVPGRECLFVLWSSSICRHDIREFSKVSDDYVGHYASGSAIGHTNDGWSLMTLGWRLLPGADNIHDEFLDSIQCT